MQKIYIDTRHSFSVSSKTGKFNGGNNYSKRIIRLIIDKNCENVKIVLICSHDSLEYVKTEFKDSQVELLSVCCLSEIVVSENDVYFTPMLDDSRAFSKELRSFKIKNPKARIYMTIHDRRHMENWYDKYDGILKDGIKRNPLLLAIGRFLHALNIECAIKESIQLSDKVFTVSNYSMQKIIKTSKVKNISWFYQGVYGYDENPQTPSDDFILFVSAGRSEKNLIRSLYAFEKYVKSTGNRYTKLRCTGISAEKKELLKKKLMICTDIFDEQIEFMGYVSQEKLNSLYQNCKFLLFASKNEGFGLPVLEAALHYKPVVASNRSSIPEVLGATALYVDPYDIESISKGIEQMMEDDVYNFKKEIIEKKRKILLKQIQLDTEILLEEILNN